MKTILRIINWIMYGFLLTSSFKQIGLAATILLIIIIIDKEIKEWRNWKYILRLSNIIKETVEKLADLCDFKVKKTKNEFDKINNIFKN
jgi:uncharacterized membrane protein YccF (DUF307 family)